MDAIPTTHNGVHFRSRLEATRPAAFDILGWPWRYEPIDLVGYIPDFIIDWPRAPILFEVKPCLTLPELYQHTEKIDGAGWAGEAVIVGAGKVTAEAQDDPQPIIGAMSQHQPCESGWDAAVLIKCLACNSYSIIHFSGMWLCQRCGAYEGNGHIGWLPQASFDDLWREAGNKTQWRPGNGR